MTTPLPYLPPASATHYRPPSSLHLPLYLLSLTFCTPLAIAAAFLYIYARSKIDGFPYHIASSLAFSTAVGLLAMCVPYFGKVRNRTPAILAASLVSCSAVYAMWLAWLHHYALGQISYVSFITSAHLFASAIYQINQLGTWSFRNHTIAGIPLAFIWLIESALPIAAAVFFSLHALNDDAPLCRDCNKPCTPVPDLPRFSTEREEDFLTAIDNRDFASLASFDPPDHEHAPELVLRLYTCRHCLTTHVLTVTRLAWHFNSQNIPSVRATPLVNQLLLTPDEALTLAATCHQILASRTPTDPTPPDPTPEPHM